MSYNEKGDSIKLEDIKTFLEEYYKRNKTTPKLKEWKEKDGFPCNKEYLLKRFGKYNDLLEKLGYTTYSYGKRRYNEDQLLSDYKNSIIKYRTANIDEIRKQNKSLKSKEVYINIFGSINNVLKLLEINQEHIYLLSMFEDYTLQDPVLFLKIKLGKNNDFTLEQKNLISQIQQAVDLKKDIRRDALKNDISLYNCKRLFCNFTLAMIASGFSPCVKMRKAHKTIDGHICDSYEEMLIDNMLTEFNIPHTTHVNYPNSKYKCDFCINNNYFIEYTGYSNKKNQILKNKYLQRLENKVLIAKNHNIQVLIISNIEEAREKIAVALHSDMH